MSTRILWIKGGDYLLDAWASAHSNGAIDVINQGEDDNWGLTPTLCNTFVPVFRRQSTLTSRDVLTLGIRAVCFLMGNLYFSAVYVESRQRPPGPGRESILADYLVHWGSCPSHCIVGVR